MRTDGLFTLSKYVIKDWQYNKPLILRPFGDVHRDSPAHSTHKWQEFLESSRTSGDMIFLGMGDYLDAYSSSERSFIYNEKLHESTRRREEEQSMSRISALAKELAPVRNRTVGILGGNHYVQFSDGTNGDMRLAALLNAPYLGVCSAIRLIFLIKGRHANTMSVDLFAHHGRGAGMTAAGKFNAVEKLTQICEADIFLMGDNHARGTFPLGDKLRISSSNGSLHLRSRQAWIGRTGSFLKSYAPNEPSYVVDRALTPANLGWIDFILTPKRIRNDGQDREYVEIKAVQ